MSASPTFMAHHEFAVQLYTLRNEAAQDFPGTLRQVAEAGISAVEFAGFGSYTVAEMRKLLYDVGLVAMGAHTRLHLLESDLDKEIEAIQTLGAQYVAIPSWPANQLTTADDFRRAGETLARMGERCKAAGVQFSYHNHAFEFVQFDGTYGLDLLLEAASPDVLTAQFDLGWIAYAGADPIAFLRKYAGRAPTVHFKDMITEPERYDVPSGEGILPLPELIQAGRAGGTKWFIIELDTPREAPIECVRRSAAYLKLQGLR